MTIENPESKDEYPSNADIEAFISASGKPNRVQKIFDPESTTGEFGILIFYTNKSFPGRDSKGMGTAIMPDIKFTDDDLARKYLFDLTGDESLLMIKK